MNLRDVYFPHDSNARHDPKLVKLRRKFGRAWCVVYWWILEKMRGQDHYGLPFSTDDDAANLCDEFSTIEDIIQLDEMKKFILWCIDTNLFYRADGNIFSASFLRRMDKVEQRKSIARRAAAAKYGTLFDENDPKKADSDIDALHNGMHNGVHDAMHDGVLRKEKKRKEKKERKEKENAPSAISSLLNSFPDSFRALWDQYVALRKKRRWVHSQEWQEKTLRRLQTFNDPMFAVRNSFDNEYQGLFDGKQRKAEPTRAEHDEALEEFKRRRSTR